MKTEVRKQMAGTNRLWSEVRIENSASELKESKADP
jgi:hypothetical protein